MKMPNDQCPYSCPYSLNQLNHTQEDAIQYIDLDELFDFPGVMVSTNDDDVPSLGDIWNSEDDTNMEYTCDTLLIVTHLCTIWMYNRTSSELYL